MKVDSGKWKVEFADTINVRQGMFGLDLDDPAIQRLADYYGLVLEDNPLLHLVAPCSAEEFATRHVLESLTLLKHLPKRAKFADVGTGAGLPSIPCLLARVDLKAMLIESKEKKAKFLVEAVRKLELEKRAEIVNRQFAEADATDRAYVTCRALDKFTEKLPDLVRWSRQRTLLLFGGDNLREALKRHRLPFTEELMPLSEKRFLFVVSGAKR